jgi:hypothetical protein
MHKPLIRRLNIHIDHMRIDMICSHVISYIIIIIIIFCLVILTITLLHNLHAIYNSFINLLSSLLDVTFHVC